MNKRQFTSNFLNQLTACHSIPLMLIEHGDCRIINYFSAAHHWKAEKERNNSTETNKQIHSAECNVCSIFQHSCLFIMKVDEDLVFVNRLFIVNCIQLEAIRDSCTIRQTRTFHSFFVSVKIIIFKRWLYSINKIVVINHTEHRRDVTFGIFRYGIEKSDRAVAELHQITLSETKTWNAFKDLNKKLTCRHSAKQFVCM